MLRCVCYRDGMSYVVLPKGKGKCVVKGEDKHTTNTRIRL